MASNQDEGSVRSADDTTSSLGDSAYDFVDDSSFATTDDDEPVLTGRTLAERVYEASDNEDLERTVSTNSVRPHSEPSSQQNGMHESLYSTTSEDDVFDEQHSEPYHHAAQDQRMPPSIKFVDVHHGEGAFLLDSASAPHNLAVTVRQHMLDQTLSLDGPYRLLYVGDAAARERIVVKIGAALASTYKDEAPRPLRYSVVPMPFSDDPECSSEPVLLDWSSHEIVVYQCVSASFGRRDSGHDTIDLNMDREAQVQSFWDGSKFDLSKGWQLPDMSIFYLSEGDGVSAKQTRRLARSFVARHKIPAIVVSERPTWEKPSEAITIERFSPHICLQTNHDLAISSNVVKRLPIDLSTLVRLDALQLNKNLAYLAVKFGYPRTRNGTEQTPKKGDQKKFSQKLDMSPAWMAIRGYFGAARSGLSYLAALLVTVLICSCIVPRLNSLPVHSVNQDLKSVTNDSSTPTPSSPSLVATSIVQWTSRSKMPQSLTVPSPAALVRTQLPPARKSHTDLATLLESTPMMVNKAEKFQVHVLGDAHIVLRPPHWFTRLKKAPRLNINTTRDDRTVKHQLSILFDGVYALELPSDEARGTINISVWTNSKPKIHEKLQVDFGNPWLCAFGWKKAVNAMSGSFRQDLDLVQRSLGTIITRSGAGVYSVIKEALGRAHQLKVETQNIRKESVGRMAGITDRIFASTRYVTTGPSWFLKQQKEVVGERLSAEAEKWRRNILSYTLSKARVARIYVEATPAASRIQWRNTQKEALKVWWRMTGLPRRPPVSVASKAKPRSYGGRLKKRAFGK